MEDQKKQTDLPAIDAAEMATSTFPPAQYNWSPIIFGRTYEVDYGFLAIPEDFSEKEQRWVYESILPTLPKSGKKTRMPDYVVITRGNHLVVGITCMVIDLVHVSSMPNKKELCVDRAGRPLYTFCGWVLLVGKETPQIPFEIQRHLLLSRELLLSSDYFKNLSHVYTSTVKELWRKSSFELKEPLRRGYATITPSAHDLGIDPSWQEPVTELEQRERYVRFLEKDSLELRSQIQVRDQSVQILTQKSHDLKDQIKRQSKQLHEMHKELKDLSHEVYSLRNVNRRKLSERLKRWSLLYLINFVYIVFILYLIYENFDYSIESLGSLLLMLGLPFSTSILIWYKLKKGH